MNKRIFWILGSAMVLGLGILFGAGVLYFGLQTSTVQAAANLQATVVPTSQAGGDRNTGLLVGAVASGSPADKAGIVRGDIILEANGKAINQANPGAEKSLLQNLKPNDKVTLKVLHGDESRTVDVILGDQNGAAYLGISPAFTMRGPFPFGGKTMPNLPSGSAGAWVIQVTSGGPADKAGVKAGDVITKVNDQVVDANNDLAKVLGALKPGANATLTLQRQGQTTAVTSQVSLGDNPNSAGQAYLGIEYRMLPVKPATNAPNGGQAIPNMPFRKMPNGATAAAGLSVGSVTTGSPAEQAGLKAQDVITQVNGKAVTNPNDFVNQVKAAKPGDKFTLTVVRGGNTASPLTITATLGTNPDNSGTAYLGITVNGMLRNAPKVAPTPGKSSGNPGGNT
jgi:S1-C subfamily serine protease